MQKLELSNCLYDDRVRLGEKTCSSFVKSLSSNTTFERSVNQDAQKGSQILVKKIDGDLYLCEKSHRGVLNWTIHCLFVSKEKRVCENRRSFIFAESTPFKSCSLREKTA